MLRPFPDATSLHERPGPLPASDHLLLDRDGRATLTPAARTSTSRGFIGTMGGMRKPPSEPPAPRNSAAPPAQSRPLPGLRYTGTDFYCDVAIPGTDKLDVVHEDALVLAFHHTRPHWPTHLVVVPKRHLASLTTVGAEDERDLRALFGVVQRIAREVETTQGAAGVLTNLGSYQDSKHLHIHVYTGDKLR